MCLYGILMVFLIIHMVLRVGPGQPERHRGLHQGDANIWVLGEKGVEKYRSGEIAL